MKRYLKIDNELKYYIDNLEDVYERIEELRKERVKKARRKRALYTVIILAIALVEVIVLI